MQQADYDNAIGFFAKAAQKSPTFRDPYLLRGIAIVRQTYSKHLKGEMKVKQLKEGKRELN